MKRRLLQHLRGFRGGSGVLVIAFLLLPYFVDVAYHGDGDPTPYAQAIVTDGQEDDSAEDEDSLLPADDQEKSVIELGLTLRDASTQRGDPARTVFPLQYLFLAALTSRPPPAL